MKKKIFCILDDDKTQYMKQYGEIIGLEIVIPPIKRKTLFCFYLLKCVLTFRKPDAVIIRYLNDKKSFLHSFLIFVLNYATFVVAKVSGVKIIWFCHNIDRETIEYHPFLIRLQRVFLEKYSSRIYVMDELLIEVAKKQFPKVTDKIDFISFGMRENPYLRGGDGDNELLINAVNEIRSVNSNAIIGFCPTNCGDKYLHIKYSADLVESCKNAGLDVYIILVGKLENYLELRPKIKNSLYKSDRVILIDKFVHYDATEVGKCIDFYWRGLNDQSISYSLYEAASQKRPTLSLNVGFVGVAVEYYNLGAIVELDMNNCESSINRIRHWDSSYASDFLSSHSWYLTVEKIKHSL
ncbi:glycosyltransferase [Vibrio fluvialis]|uniref:glycosyltransferase n=1 Tax=Vibrio fluvialis TaxID=676 RepID=UPI00192B2DBB|nr:glycosyltransferase [Vibrio fluvialis]MBL4288154.1 glycosyltransferase [Vibrio fluvialis]MBL4293632.1 glycosyltransferase [Vibrio fluvialis]